MSNHQHLRVAITTGDLNGTGIEIIIKTLTDHRVFQDITPVIFGSSKSISFYRKLLNSAEFNYNTVKPGESPIANKVNVINCWEEEIKIEPGASTVESAKYAFLSFEHAVNAIQSGNADVLVTSAIDKHTIAAQHPGFRGHTEYLAEKFSASDHLMLLAAGNLRVGVVTGHIPLQQVAAALTVDAIVRKARVMHAALAADFGIGRPKIAILGLNPHAGDGGIMGSEESEVIGKAIQILKDEKMLVFGPFPADGFFGTMACFKFDGVLAMYHDQGLIPFKTLAFDNGVNVTCGLPVVRTSPDHGPAFDIAGKNIASESSFREAIFLACDIWNKRNEYSDLIRNRLPVGLSKYSADQ